MYEHHKVAQVQIKDLVPELQLQESITTVYQCLGPVGCGFMFF